MRNEARLATFIAKAAEEIADDGTQWIEVMPTADKVRNGPWYQTITRSDLEIYAASIRSSAGKIPIDRDHGGDTDNLDLRDTRAAGWFVGEAEVRDTDDGPRLYALVEWTPRAVQEIRDGEYRYLSPTYTFVEKDPKTGLLTKAAELIAATLTNRPFFDDLAPVTAAVVWESGAGLQDLLSRVYDALNPGGYDNAAYWVVDVTQTKALVGEYDGHRTWVVPFTVSDDGAVDVAARADWTAAEQEWVEAASASLQVNRAMRPFREGAIMHESLKAIASELGLADDATDEQVVAAVKATKAKAESGGEGDGDGTGTVPEGTVVLASDQVAELQSKAAAGERAGQRLAEIEVENMLADAVRAGKIFPAQHESLKAWGLQDADALKAHIEATPEHSFKQTPKGSGEEGDDGGEDGAAVKAVERTVSRGSDAKNDRPVEGADIVVEAEKILAAAGKTEPTEGEYAKAIEQASDRIAAKAA